MNIAGLMRGKLFMPMVAFLVLSNLTTCGFTGAKIWSKNNKLDDQKKQIEEMTKSSGALELSLEIAENGLNECVDSKDKLKAAQTELNALVEQLSTGQLEKTEAQKKVERERDYWRRKANEKTVQEIDSGETNINDYLRGLAQ